LSLSLEDELSDATCRSRECFCLFDEDTDVVTVIFTALTLLVGCEEVRKQ